MIKRRRISLINPIQMFVCSLSYHLKRFWILFTFYHLFDNHSFVVDMIRISIHQQNLSSHCENESQISIDSDWRNRMQFIISEHFIDKTLLLYSCFPEYQQLYCSRLFDCISNLSLHTYPYSSRLHLHLNDMNWILFHQWLPSDEFLNTSQRLCQLSIVQSQHSENCWKDTNEEQWIHPMINESFNHYNSSDMSQLHNLMCFS